MNPDNLIPEQRTGGYSDTVSSEKFDSSLQAQHHFSLVKHRFFDIKKWSEYAKVPGAEFQLYNAAAAETDGKPQVGYYFRITMPFPKNPAGQESDWVQVEEIQEGENFAAMRVRPVHSPLGSETEETHFFQDEATSTFIVKCVADEVFAEVHGRNEKPNISAEYGIIENIRNAAVAIGGMLFGSKFQWKSLTAGLVEK